MKQKECEHCKKARPFMNWNIDSYTANSPFHEGNKYKVWIANGIGCFKDYKNQEIFLAGLNKSEKKQVWDLLQKELWHRSQDALKELEIKLK